MSRARSHNEVVVEVGVEGGSLTVFGERTDRGWRFSLYVNDSTPVFLDEEPIQYKSNKVQSWDAAIALLDNYQWWRFSPIAVHPEFRKKVWEAVRARGGELRDWESICKKKDSVSDLHFLPGVPVSHVLARLANAGGNEIESGKLSSPSSSAALAVNCFGWFVERPERLPPLPRLKAVGVPEYVEVEFCARFPWRGGRHPWLDAVVRTSTALIGIESKRFEPFRDVNAVRLSPAYDRRVWGSKMTRYEGMRDRLRSGAETFVHLDAAQLIKHAFGLVSEGSRENLKPILYYIFAEPSEVDGHVVSADDLKRHRDEIMRFSTEVAEDEVIFRYASYREWLDTWHLLDSSVAAHGRAVMESFDP